MVTQARDGATGSHGQRYRKKKCSKCGESRPIYDFQKSSRTKDGFSTQCKMCLNIPRRDRDHRASEDKRLRGLALRELLKNHRVEYERLLTFYTEKSR